MLADTMSGITCKVLHISFNLYTKPMNWYYSHFIGEKTTIKQIGKDSIVALIYIKAHESKQNITHL